MKLPLVLCSLVLFSTTAIAADTKSAKPQPCPKGQVATTSKITGEQHCFTPTVMMGTPAQTASGKSAAPVLKKN